MPLVDYECTDCPHVIEDVVYLQSEEQAAQLDCPACDGVALKKFPLIARTAHSWGDTNSYFDRGLGTVVRNRQHRERLCKEKGLVPLDDMPAHHWEDQTAAKVKRVEKRQQLTDRYTAALKKHHGDKIKAIPEALPARECLSGAINDIWED